MRQSESYEYPPQVGIPNASAFVPESSVSSSSGCSVDKFPKSQVFELVIAAPYRFFEWFLKCVWWFCDPMSCPAVCPGIHRRSQYKTEFRAAISNHDDQVKQC